ncbi:hypothetical protein BDR06DRAFT_971533 [Suillus hirtellus]|nr:hypothetical protein BDR06DRAFT_971533 [Suillus hirtellus]
MSEWVSAPLCLLSSCLGMMCTSKHHNLYGIQTNLGASKYFPIIGLLNKVATDFKESVTPIVEKIFGHKPNVKIVKWPKDKNKWYKVLIMMLEYEIIDWKLKVKDLDYPTGKPVEPIKVIIFIEPYRIKVEMLVLNNITYVIFDRPMFHALTTSDPYSAYMNNLSFTNLYSIWNQATICQFPVINIYHINDYHSLLAPIYLLPKVAPVCLSLPNAEFQSLWLLHRKEEMEEVCSALNISKEHCIKYVQAQEWANIKQDPKSNLFVLQVCYKELISSRLIQ